MAVVLIAASATLTASRQSAREGPVWFWFATCGGPLMTLEVRLDNRILKKVTFPLCHANREAVDRQGEVRSVDFTFRAGRTILWEGYRETHDRTAANDVIEGNIWQAGADPDSLILGVDFVSGKRILMNTLHIVRPFARDESMVARGLVVRTYPAVKSSPR